MAEMAGRLLSLSTTFGRSLRKLGVVSGSSRQRTVMLEARAIAERGDLPGPSDYETRYGAGSAHVRRVPRENVWILYRFDAERVYVMQVEGTPPVPLDDQ